MFYTRLLKLVFYNNSLIILQLNISTIVCFEKCRSQLSRIFATRSMVVLRLPVSLHTGRCVHSVQVMDWNETHSKARRIVKRVHSMPVAVAFQGFFIPLASTTFLTYPGLASSYLWYIHRRYHPDVVADVTSQSPASVLLLSASLLLVRRLVNHSEREREICVKEWRCWRAERRPR